MDDPCKEIGCGYLLIKTGYVPDTLTTSEEKSRVLLYQRILKNTQELERNVSEALDREDIVNDDKERFNALMGPLQEVLETINKIFISQPKVSEFTTAHKQIATDINGILNEFQDKLQPEGIRRFSIVETDEPDLNIIVSFAAIDDESFNNIADEIMNRQLFATVNSEVHVSEITKAKHKDKPVGFEGPP